jgi:hypothetical protein
MREVATAFATLKIAVLAPMPSAMVTTAVKVNRRLRDNTRLAILRVCNATEVSLIVGDMTHLWEGDSTCFPAEGYIRSDLKGN